MEKYITPDMSVYEGDLIRQYEAYASSIICTTGAITCSSNAVSCQTQATGGNTCTANVTGGNTCTANVSGCAAASYCTTKSS